MTETTTRQERRKQRTRALIRETAWELFAAHGYDATTIKAIADSADVAPRTVTMHFPAKDDLLFADDDYFGADRLERRLTARPAGQPALETLRQWMIETISQADRRKRPAPRPGARLLRDRGMYPRRGHRRGPPRRARRPRAAPGRHHRGDRAARAV